MIFRKSIATSAVPLIAAGLVAAGCGLFGDDAEDDDGGGKGGGGTAGSAGGLTGGSVTGGTSGTGPSGGTTTGGASGSAGATTGGAGGSGGATTGGAAGGGGQATGPFSCATPATANCNVIGDFPAGTGQAFGNSDFSGGVSIFPGNMPTTIMRDTSTTNLHVTGMVSGYGVGFNIWFTKCTTLAAYTGIQFTISGMTTDMTPMMMNSINFELQTNVNYPWQPFPPENGKGACTGTDPMNPWGMCIAPGIRVPVQTAAQTVTWAQMMGGMPTAWTAADSPKELVGIQWQFAWSDGRMPYTFDVTLDDISFVGGTPMACPPYMAGGGGMGGMGGAGGAAAGMAGAAGGGRGGMAGAGGAAAGAAGGGRGGMAGAGGG